MKLLWRIYLSFFACALLTLALSSWYAASSLHLFYQDEVEKNLLAEAGVLAADLAFQKTADDPARVDALCKAYGRLTGSRLTVIRPDGTVAGDSEAEASAMENHRHRPEVAAALAGREGRSIRFSETARRHLMYKAIPFDVDGKPAGAVRASMPLSAVGWMLSSVYRQALLGVLLAGLLFALLAFFLSRRISLPLETLRLTAERLADGDLSARATAPRTPELKALARTLNRMAGQLGERLETITRQRDRQDAVFASMVEGVVAVDGDGRLLDVNGAAERLLDLNWEQTRGRSIQEAVRNPDLQAFIMATLAEGGPREAEITLFGRDERTLQLHGTALADSAGRRLGALVVLHDITRLKRLETMRQDFVANVSHELKTPITALKGCVETLSGDAPPTPEDHARFLAMMGRQVDRLHTLVEDLLSLSRIEHDARHGRIPLEPGSVCDVLRRAVQSFAKAADAKGASVALDCDAGLSAPINPALLEQAVGNLIDNAVKYGGEKPRIAVSAAAAGNGLVIRVRDEGPGIEKKHLARIFERFYRVDQARSRALGGTGLGLAIVKHIALAHGGSVEVDSAPGHGSTFTINLPAARPPAAG